MNPADLILLSLIFFAISVLYSSVGFGGGSSYLAILALFGVHFMTMKSIALLCNIIVVIGNVIVFRKKNLIPKTALLISLISISFAFLGGLYDIKSRIFFVLLGVSLIVAAILLFISVKKKTSLKESNNKILAYSSGCGLGLLSGLVGIGGGIFLSPLLNLLNWDTPKRIAATASVFILLNSIAGLLGHFIRSAPTNEDFLLAPLFISVLLGGQLGVHLTAFKLKQEYVKIITSILVFAAGFKILYNHL